MWMKCILAVMVFSSLVEFLGDLVMTGEPASYSSKINHGTCIEFEWFWINLCMSSVFSGHFEGKKYCTRMDLR